MNNKLLLVAIGALVGLILGIIIGYSFNKVSADVQPGNGTILGTVTDPTGRVMPGVKIWDYYKKPDGTYRATKKTKTNDKGKFKISNVLAGDHRIKARAEGYGADLDLVISGNQAVAADMKLSEPKITGVSGIVTSIANGSPISNVEVYNSENDLRAKTDRNGFYHIMTLTYDEVLTTSLTATSNNPNRYDSKTQDVEMQAGKVTPLNFSLVDVWAAWGNIEGNITNDKGEVVAGAVIQAINPYGDTVATGTSDEQGYYIITNIPEGTVYLTFSAENHSSVAKKTRINDNQQKKIDVVLTKLAAPPAEGEEPSIKVEEE